MALNVLIIGSGGREHALAWKLKQSPRVSEIYAAPGNGGTEQICENVSIPADDIPALAQFAVERNIDLTIVGSETSIAAGIVDYFQAHGRRIFGPTKEAAKLQSSKSFAKKLIADAHIPTPKHYSFANYDDAIAGVRRLNPPYVVKSDGIADGHGVYICQTLEEAEAVIKGMMVDGALLDAGRNIVIEEYVSGPSISVHALTDGVNFMTLPASQLLRQIGENDTGKNALGVGAVAPVPFVTPETMVAAEQHVIAPVFEAVRKQGIMYSGVLAADIKISSSGLQLISFSTVVSDPEFGLYMRLLQGDVLDLFEHCIDGGVTRSMARWGWGLAAGVVLCVGNDPDAFDTAKLVSGIKDAEKMPDVLIFHMGTRYDGDTFTYGHRVLNVTATGSTVEEVVRKAYLATEKIDFKGKYLRRDVGATAEQKV